MLIVTGKMKKSINSWSVFII